MSHKVHLCILHPYAEVHRPHTSVHMGDGLATCCTIMGDHTTAHLLRPRRGHTGAYNGGRERDDARGLGNLYRRLSRRRHTFQSSARVTSLATLFRFAVEDLKSSYFEAVTAQPGQQAVDSRCSPTGSGVRRRRGVCCSPFMTPISAATCPGFRWSPTAFSSPGHARLNRPMPRRSVTEDAAYLPTERHDRGSRCGLSRPRKGSGAFCTSLYGIATMFEPVPCFCRGHGLQGLADRGLEGLARPRLGGAPGGPELAHTKLHG